MHTITYSTYCLKKPTGKYIVSSSEALYSHLQEFCFGDKSTTKLREWDGVRLHRNDYVCVTLENGQKFTFANGQQFFAINEDDSFYHDYTEYKAVIEYCGYSFRRPFGNSFFRSLLGYRYP